MTATRAAIDAATQIIASAQVSARRDPARAAAVALADAGQLVTPVVVAELVRAALVEAAKVIAVQAGGIVPVEGMAPEAAACVQGMRAGLELAHTLVLAQLPAVVAPPTVPGRLTGDPCDPVEDEPLPTLPAQRDRRAGTE